METLNYEIKYGIKSDEERRVLFIQRASTIRRGFELTESHHMELSLHKNTEDGMKSSFFLSVVTTFWSHSIAWH